MKMVKSLLLGSAAGLVAVSAGQAADLPVKAKPVEYVKVCSLYGAGFYYMPGTDICLKIGGYVRAETTYHSNGNFGAGPTSADVNNRTTNEFVMRARAYITADAREQTAWGTARAYVAVGVATTDTGATVTPSILGFNRAFIQWAGITAGITQSFYDFYSAAAVGYRAYNPSEDTGDSGWWVWAYTAQLGNGLSVSISAEQRRASQIIGVGQTIAVVPAEANTVGGNGLGITVPSTTAICGSTVIGGSVNTGCYGGIQVPDFVANIRLDQTWGSAQVMGVVHQVNAQYYGTGVSFEGSTAPLNGASENRTLGTNGNLVTASGHPGDEWGWVVGAGLRLNFPSIAQGDYFQGEVNYTQGALKYLQTGNGAPNYGWERGNSLGFGITSDCVYGANTLLNATTPNLPATGGTGCLLTTAWSLNVSYEHYWTPQFHESFVGGYLRTEYDTEANNLLCIAERQPSLAGAPLFSQNITTARGTPGCNNNFDIWTAATRLQYDFTKTLYLGVEFLYQHLDTATLPNNQIGTFVGGPANPLSINRIAPANNGISGITQISDQNNLAVTLRMHKDFLP